MIIEYFSAVSDVFKIQLAQETHDNHLCQNSNQWKYQIAYELISCTGAARTSWIWCPNFIQHESCFLSDVWANHGYSFVIRNFHKAAVSICENWVQSDSYETNENEHIDWAEKRNSVSDWFIRMTLRETQFI